MAFAIWIFFTTSVFAKVKNKILLPVNPDQTLVNTIKKDVKSVSFFQIDENELQKMYNEASSELEMDLPLPSGDQLHLKLKKTEVTTSNFKILTSGGVVFKEKFESPNHYQGKINGIANSLAAISFTPKSVFFVGSDGKGNYNLVKLKSKFKGKDLYAFYNDRDLLAKNNFTCHSEELDQFKKGTEILRKSKNNLNKSPQVDNCRKATIHFDLDYQMYLDNGSSVPNTVTWFQSMFNVLASLYTNENIRIEVSEVQVATRQDFWPDESSFDVLYAYGDTLSNRAPIEGNLAHLLSTKNLGHGGVAYLDVLCGSSNNYAYSNINYSFAQLPVYSWTINVVAHELGHNFGSPHTQSCTWEVSPGVFNLLDSCYAAQNGNCYSGPVVPIFGTVMSYCHLVLGIDLAKGFGPLPGNLIRERFFSGQCLEGTVTFQNITVSGSDTVCNGSNKTLSVSLDAGSNYTWSGPNGFTSNLRTPTVSNISDLSSGEYSVFLDKSGCKSQTYKTSLTVDCIPVLRIPDLSLCQNQISTFPFVSSDPVLAGNVYSLEISNSSGGFTNPTIIGSTASNQLKASINGVIPTSFQVGTGYKIRVKSSNPQKTGKPYPLNISVSGAPSAPNVSNQNRCNPGIFTFSATGNSFYEWFNDSLVAIPLATGNSFSTPVLSSSRSYWVSSQSQTKLNFGPTDPFFTGDATELGNFSHGLYIKVLKDVRIDTLTIYPTGTGLVRFNVKDSANSVTYASTSFQVNNAIGTAVKIPIRLNLSPGVYRIDPSGSTVENMLRSVGDITFPISSPGLLQIIGATALNRYYWFYSWKITSLECPSARKKVQALFTGAPNSPTVSNVSRCGSGSVSLVANGASSGDSYRWYTSSTGGSPIAGQSSGTYNVNNVTTNTTWYVSIFTSGNCESQRVAISATINQNPIPPGTFAGNRCGPGTVNLSANGTGQSYKWYSTQTGGTAFPGEISAAFVTPVITQTTNFYVSVVAANGCESTRSLSTASINPIPQSPNTIAGNRCGTGSVQLSASGSGQSYTWYAVPVGGNPISGQFTSNFTSPVISQTTTYYVSTTGTGLCESARSPVIATINPIPQNPTTTDGNRCGPGSVNISANGSGQSYKWYDVQVGGTAISGQNTSNFSSPTISQTTTYYVSVVGTGNCESNRSAVVATINQIPQNPTTTDGNRCGPGTVNLSANGSGQSYKWYDVQVGGTAISGQNTSNFSSPTISQTTTYYVSVVGPGNCESNRSAVVATINQIPQNPTTIDGNRCGPGTVNLSANGSGQSYKWYDVQVGGTAISGQSSSIFASPILNQTTNYYVSVVGTGNCESNRSAVVATINQIPQNPTTTDGNRCGSGSVTLSASGSGSIYKWYDVPNGGTAISGQSTSNFSSPTLSQTTTYYVSIEGTGNCESNRSTVVATINPIPENPTVTNQKRCGPGNFQFSANGGSSYNWFTDLSSPALPGQTASTFTSPVFNSGTVTYYVSSLSAAGCISADRIPVQGIITDRPSSPIVQDSSRCGPGTVRLLANGSAQGETYRWYPVPFNSVSDSVQGTNGGNSLTTSFLSQTKEFAVVKVKEGFCESAQATIAKAIILSIPQTPVLEFVPGYIRANQDTVYNWFRNGVFIGSFGDSLDLSVYGNGSYFAELVRANSCKAQSNVLVFTSSIAAILETINPILFPNPNNGSFSVSGLSESEETIIQLFDSQGKMLLSDQSRSKVWDGNIQNHAAGFYILKIQSRKNISVIKLKKD